MRVFVVHTAQDRARIIRQFRSVGADIETGWMILNSADPGSITRIRGVEISEVWWTTIGFHSGPKLEDPSKPLEMIGGREVWRVLYAELKALLRTPPMLWIEP